MEEPTFDSILEPDQEEPTPEETAPPPAGDSNTPPNTVPTHPSPALTIHFQSWATPVVGLVMLVFGLIAGYVARPIWEPSLTPVTQAPSESSSSTSAEQPASTQPVPEDQAARQQQLMEVVLSRTRHFKGDANAPVTLVEFSDFQ